MQNRRLMPSPAMRGRVRVGVQENNAAEGRFHSLTTRAGDLIAEDRRG